MAAVIGSGPLPACLTTSAKDPLCERVNKVAWGSIWPLALAIGLGSGGLVTWAFAFNPWLTLAVSVGLTFYVAAVYFLFQWPLPYTLAKGFELLNDTSTHGPFCMPCIALPCGHTAEENSALTYINYKGKCTVSCEQKLTKGDFVPNRLIIGLLNALHNKKGDEADLAFNAFVKRHKDESMTLPDGRSCDVLGQVLLMRARDHKGTWEAFCDAHAKDLYRGDSKVEFRVGVDEEALQAALGQGDYDPVLHAQLEAVYQKSTYNMRWQRVVDKYWE